MTSLTFLALSTSLVKTVLRVHSLPIPAVKSEEQLKNVTSEFGELSISAAVDSELVNDFHALGALHISQWGETPEGSGFQNPAFVKHHETILNLAPSSVEILQVRAGDTLVAYGYYLIHNRRAYFYCSGINFDIATNSIKPGYLLHYLAMCHFSEQGLLSYDFLGGDYRYKKSLSNHNYDFTTMTFFSSSPVAKVLEAANRVIKKCTNLMVSSHQNESV
ncbi:GNAT family N-acetyltransferase [Alteromonas sp. KUL49]|nr:GNAT family N-acetyltransferase [Alteromonas sp. KUL49]